MRYCSQCGKQIDDTMKFCPSCGAVIDAEQKYDTYENDYSYKNEQQAQNHVPYQQTGGHRSTHDQTNDKVLAILSYLGILVLVPVLMGAKSRFVKFHANQGLVLFLCGVIWNVLKWVLSHFLWFLHSGILSLGTILSIGNLALAVFAVIGIVYACKGEEKELPLIGGIIILK